MSAFTLLQSPCFRIRTVGHRPSLCKSLLNTLPLILLILLLGWFWFDSLRTREIAIGICRAACARRRVQFLDQTVALHRLGLRWPPAGLRFRRVYRFDYSEEGVGRRSGYLVMLGVDLEEISLGLPHNADDA